MSGKRILHATLEPNGTVAVCGEPVPGVGAMPDEEVFDDADIERCPECLRLTEWLEEDEDE